MAGSTDPGQAGAHDEHVDMSGVLHSSVRTVAVAEVSTIQPTGAVPGGLPARAASGAIVDGVLTGAVETEPAVPGSV